MTNKELLYVEDALEHEKFMRSCSQKAAKKLTDPSLIACVKELEKTHSDLFNKFLNLL